LPPFLGWVILFLYMLDWGRIKSILEKEPRLIRLPNKGKVVFVGDTHGDLEATQKILDTYLKPGYYLVFLGDYIDRGPHSRENIEFLLQSKLERPEQIFLLMGNHEGQPILPFYPADFWEGLSIEEQINFGSIFKLFSFAAVTPNRVLALHGVPPDVASLEEIEKIELGSKEWQQITWGDFTEKKGDFLGNFWGRPVYGQDYFERVMQQLNCTVLVRAHQPHIKPTIFANRCLTIVTSKYYKPTRTIAIVDLEEPRIKTIDKITVIEI
jgi:predicted MPP superfamily phosphohydrolase